MTSTDRNLTAKVLTCEHCGYRLEARADNAEDMHVHQDECDGLMAASERFEAGEEVEFSQFGKRRLNQQQRHGEVAGFSGRDVLVRVRWDDKRSVDRYHLHFIASAGSATSQTEDSDD